MDLDVSDNRFAQNSDAQPSRITATGRQEGLGRGRGVEGVPPATARTARQERLRCRAPCGSAPHRRPARDRRSRKDRPKLAHGWV